MVIILIVCIFVTKFSSKGNSAKCPIEGLWLQIEYIKVCMATKVCYDGLNDTANVVSNETSPPLEFSIILSQTAWLRDNIKCIIIK